MRTRSLFGIRKEIFSRSSFIVARAIWRISLILSSLSTLSNCASSDSMFSIKTCSLASYYFLIAGFLVMVITGKVNSSKLHTWLGRFQTYSVIVLNIWNAKYIVIQKNDVLTLVRIFIRVSMTDISKQAIRLNRSDGVCKTDSMVKVRRKPSIFV